MFFSFSLQILSGYSTIFNRMQGTEESTTDATLPVEFMADNRRSLM